MQGHGRDYAVAHLPSGEGNTPVEVSVGSHHYAGDGAVEALWSLTPLIGGGHQDWRLHAFRVEGPTNGNFNLTGLDIEFVPAGGR